MKFGIKFVILNSDNMPFFRNVLPGNLSSRCKNKEKGELHQRKMGG